LGTFQGLLLAALAFAWDKDDTWWIVIILCLVGLAVALSTWVATLRANEAIERVNEWWDDSKPPDCLGLGVERIKGHEGKLQKLMPGRFLPLTFFIAWMAIGLVHLTRCS
jgi:cell division protein FtsW (lipid II flippase)